MKRIYIAGPYTSPDPCANVSNAMDAWHAIFDMGAYPFCPHLCHFLHIHRQRPYADWVDWDMQWLDTCDALYRLPGDSPGADDEVLNFDGPVFYSLDALEAWLNHE